MLIKLYSKCFSNHLLIVLIVLILNSYLNYAENVKKVSTELNITVTSSSGKNVLITAPKLLGIFADGVNDSTNILEDNQYNVDININDQGKN